MAAAARAAAVAAAARADGLVCLANAKRATSDAAEADAVNAEGEVAAFCTPGRGESRAAKAAKALELAILHTSILQQKMETESRLHGPLSPQKQAAQTACVLAERKTEVIEREADWAAAENAEAEAAAAQLSAKREVAAKALRKAATAAREAAKAAAEAAAEAVAEAAAAAAAAEAAEATEVAEQRAADEARAAAEAAEAEAAAAEAAAALRREAEPQEALDLQETFEKIMREKAEAEKKLKLKARRRGKA